MDNCITAFFAFSSLLSAKSTVKLTPDAFIDPYQYTGIKETQVTVQQYKEYLSGERSINPGLKVRELHFDHGTSSDICIKISIFNQMNK